MNAMNERNQKRSTQAQPPSVHAGSRRLGVILLLLLLLLPLWKPLAMLGQGTQGTNRFIVGPATPGGLNPHPVITGVTRGEGTVLLQWFGIKGPFQVQRARSLKDPIWENLGNPVTGRDSTLEMNTQTGFLRVRGTDFNYAGSQLCALCHRASHTSWAPTRHAKAFETLRNIGQDKNPACLACHTVGFGMPGGFASEATSPDLLGVQCESCHGPAGDHAAAPMNLSLRPVISPSANICGGCHNGFHHPTYDEWNTAGHGHVTPATASYFLSADATARMNACGSCHSGAVRLSKLQGRGLPSKEDAASVSVTCAVCHDPHGDTPHAHQLRNPTFSTTFFSYSTSTNTDFAKQYKSDVNLCGQCHNLRGARPTDESRPPHHSPQYNVLIGQATTEDAALWTSQTNRQIHSSHTIIQAQCTHCHTHPNVTEEPTEERPNYTGHSFRPTFGACTACHQTEQKAEAATVKLQAEIKQRIQAVKAKLDRWGQTKSPVPLQATYGALAWEYSSAGQISNPKGLSTIKGPLAIEQPSVPASIKEARYCLYVVEHDGSYGVHNAKYARFLLDKAEANVDALLAN